MAIPVEQYVNKTLALLQKEREAEIAETEHLQENVSCRELERRGVCLLKLRIGSRNTGLYGRTVLLFEPFWPGKPLPSHSFTPGDIAGLYESSSEGNKDQLASGIVSKVTATALSVAFDESHDTLSFEDSMQYRLVKLANDVTYRRIKRALQEMHRYRGGPASHLLDVMFGEAPPSPPFNTARDGQQAQHLQDLKFLNEKLDASQQEAVKFALSQRELAIIHGPPGTGKTTTVVEIIKQAVKQGLKILACAPSNIAVDNLLERLAGSGIRLVRLGHPARLLPSIQKYSLDAVLARSDESQVTDGIRDDMEKAQSQLRKSNNRGEKQKLREELRTLRKELRQQELTATARVLKGSQVVMATLTTATDNGPMKHLEEQHFDLVIIDECSQALEAACWIALLRGPRCILAGDHKQLPPTILSHQAAKDGLAETLMERQIGLHGDKVVKMLVVQYRMHHLIMDWSSRQLYDGQLQAHESVANHLVRDLADVVDTEETSLPLLLVDTAGCDMQELDVPEEISKGNESEVELVGVHVEKLISSGLQPKDIAVIAPYNLQVELLRLRLLGKHPGLEIKSVDGFQGREKEAVIISLVRSNDKGEVGFLAEDRRINVAITRARRHLAVVCDSETVGHHAFLKSLVDYMVENGEVRSAQQYIQEGLINMDSKRPEFLESRLGGVASNQQRAAQSKAAKQKNKKKNREATDEGKARSTANNLAKKSQDLHAEADSEEVAEEEELKQILVQFTCDPTRLEHVFPTTLTSRQRFHVHDLAEQLGLVHVSQGDAADRYILVRKENEREKEKTGSSEVLSLGAEKSDYINKKSIQITETDSKTDRDLNTSRESICTNQDKNIDKAKVDNANDSTSHNRKTNKKEEPVKERQETESKVEESLGDNMTVCEECDREVPLSNMQLHKFCCRGKPQTATKIDQPKSRNKKKAKNKQKGKKAEKEEEDFDSLIAAAMKENTSCAFTKCKDNAATFGRNCEFCVKRFCISHYIPEVHGCGDQARIRARQMISREGVLYRGSGVPDKKLDPNKRAHLERKLDKKLTEMTGKRAHKKKENN